VARYCDFRRHPIVEELRHYGDPAEIAAAIDSQLNKLDALRFESIWPSGDTATVSRSWILSSSLYGLQILAIDDVVWTFMKVTTHKDEFCHHASHT
jgi:hypothetical protein